MDVIVFGIGRAAKKIFSIIEQEYHIIFFVDNNEESWETTFEGYLVKCPDEIQKYDCDIIITSTLYGAEIVKQIEDMGVDHNRIFLSRGFQSDIAYEYEICPLLGDRVKSTGLPLVQYDLYDMEESTSDKKKVLILCSTYSVYYKQLIENISRRYEDIEFSLLTCAKESKTNVISNRLKHIYIYRTMADLKTILEQLPVYDAMQLLWIERAWAYFYKLIRQKTRRLNLNVGGSEFYRADMKERDYKRELIACADRITAETVGTIEDFGQYYRKDIKNEVGLLPFGLEVLEYIKQSENTDKDIIKEKYHIPFGKYIVTCGHNANPAHQHMKLIDALEQLPNCIKENIVCVFPMTYQQRQDSYISDINDRLLRTGLDYVVLTEFMNFHEMAEYAIISDVMIHVQTTDQLSSTMLEEMYAGSVVLAGSWLPYHSLHEMGIFFLDVNTIADVTTSLEEVIKNIDEYKKKCAGNKEIVWKHSSWDELASKWHALWE